MRPKCYISGPISGREADEYLLEFFRASLWLERQGYLPVNPCNLNHGGHDQSWHGFMREDIKALMNCDAIHLLPNWHKSVGARLEYHIAQVMEMDVVMREDGPDLVVEHVPDIIDDDSMYGAWNQAEGCYEHPFSPCNECTLPDACHDHGCAIKVGLQEPLTINL